jgi:hypothetical protein
VPWLVSEPGSSMTIAIMAMVAAITQAAIVRHGWRALDSASARGERPIDAIALSSLFG